MAATPDAAAAAVGAVVPTPCCRSLCAAGDCARAPPAQPVANARDAATSCFLLTVRVSCSVGGNRLSHGVRMAGRLRS